MIVWGSTMDKDALRSVFSDASRNGWSLRSDVQLQEWLEAFAEQLKTRTKEVAADVHRLGTETGNVELLLQNNFNSLRALSATQFIENRVDEVDEVPMNKSEQPTKQSRIESYDAQIVPRYKEAVLTGWDAFQGFSSRKSSQEFSDVRSRTHQALPTKKLPHIIGTEEFMRDDHCGLADFKIPEVNARAPSSEPVESGSDTDRDEARMAADMVGERPWLDGEWLASGSETSEHQGGVLEPAVSAALDFKAMLEAALRGPAFPYDGGIMSNLENEHEQHSYVDNATILVSRDTESKSPSSLAGQDPVQQRSELHEDSSTKHEEPPVEHNTQLQSQHNLQHQSQGFASEFLEQLSRTVLMQPPPSTTSNRNDSAPVTGSIGTRSPSPPTPPSVPRSPLDDPESSSGTSLKSDSPPRVTAKFQRSLDRPQPATEFRSDDIPTPTLPEGLFQGLQEAIQARQLKSQRAEPEGEGTASEKPPVVSRSPPPVKLDLKRSFMSKSKVETSSRLQKGVSAVKRTQTPITFQGGLFDDDDLDDMSEFLSKEGTTAITTPEIQSSPLTSRSSMVRKGLFDDFGASSGGLEDKVNVSTQQSTALSLPERTESNRSRVLKKSLFGDSDEEDNNLFDE